MAILPPRIMAKDCALSKNAVCGSSVMVCSPEAVAAAFLHVNQTVAEAAFEAVVLGEGWQLRQILQ